MVNQMGSASLLTSWLIAITMCLTFFDHHLSPTPFCLLFRFCSFLYFMELLPQNLLFCTYSEAYRFCFIGKNTRVLSCCTTVPCNPGFTLFRYSLYLLRGNKQLLALSVKSQCFSLPSPCHHLLLELISPLKLPCLLCPD